MRITHYKALMKKNWINWKRTPVGSLSEIVCPLILIGVLLAVNTLFDAEQISASLLYKNASLQTPLKIKQNNNNLDENMRELADFNQPIFSFAGKGDLFSPKDNCDRRYDSNNPCREWKDEGLKQQIMGLTYTHCYESDREGRLDSKYVGIIHNGNNVGKQLEEEVLRLSKYQTEIYNQKLKKFMTDNGGSIDMSKLTPAQLTKLTALGKKPIQFEIKNFLTKQEMFDFIQSPSYRSPTVAGLCFAVLVDQLPNEGGYYIEIFMNDQIGEGPYQSLPSQIVQAYDNFISKPDLTNFNFYTKNGYSKLHNWLANLVLRSKFPNEKNGKLATISNLIVPMKGADYEQNNFSRVLVLLAFFIFLIFIVPLYRFTFRIVAEKETKSRESMKMMGLTDSSYWLSWASYFAILVTIISLIIVIMLNSLIKTDPVIMFLICWVYGMSLFGYSLIMQSLFTKARTAGGFATTVYFIASFFDQIVNKPFHTYAQKTFASLLSPVAMNRIIYVMSVAEGHQGLNWQNINDEYENYVVAHGIIVMAISGILTSLVGLYLDNVIQQTYGTAKKWDYFLNREYWGCGSRLKKHNSVDRSDRDLQNESEDYYMDKRYYQKVNNPELLTQEKEDQILKVVGLKKKFGDFNAVNGINLKMYKGQIFALLGHNGAGKTTTISMLTGLITPSEGHANVFDKDLFNQMDDVRQFMGVCPQHDVLFDLLTPEEHLEVFCDFKGVPYEQKQKEIQQIIHDIDLANVQDTRACELSGGNKRKLSIAIALIGGSKFILLDEPTAGIDLSGRRKLWDMLKQYKANRIIILTTHYMDEADILGDRIGIMANGQIVCLGRSLFLKTQFGVGYRLSMVKNSNQPNQQAEKFLKMKLGEEVHKLSEVSSEITFQIPTSLSSKFKSFFQEFDQSLASIGISSYGISVTTLEEVFLRVGHGLAPEGENGSKETPVKNAIEDGDGENFSIAEHQTGFSIIQMIEQFAAIIKRRIQVYRKNNALIYEIFVPVMLMAIGLAFSKVNFFVDSPMRNLHPSAYPLKQDIFYNNQLLMTSNSDIQPAKLMSSLPQQADSFNLLQFQNKKESDQKKFESELIAFDNNLFDSAHGDLPYTYGSYFIIEANNDTKSFKTATFINTTSKDATSYYSQFLYQSILKEATGNPNFVFNVTTSAFPVSQQLMGRDASGDALFISIISGIGFALIPATIIGNIVSEKQKGLKHIQVVSGMSLISYWSANFIFDAIKTVIPCAISIGLLFLFDMGYNDSWTTILLYPIGIVPFCYAFSFFFSEEGGAQSFMLFGNVLAGSVMPMVLFVLRVIPSTIKDGDLSNKILKVIPNYTISSSINYDASKILFNQTRSFLVLADPDINRVTLEPYELDNIGGDLLALILHFIIGFTVIVVLESFTDCFAKLRKPQANKLQRQTTIEMDDDVVQEEERVANLDEKQCLVKVDGLRKVYKTGMKETVAIQKTSFAIEKGECFALLGVNGAGKTTTFKSLTKDVIPTKGILTVMGYDIHSEFDKARKYIGYCPQYDTIYDLLTVEEHLKFQMVLKGIPHRFRENMLTKILKNLNLTEYRHKNAGTLSGGNKRKLSVAMSLLGNPPVILLDEPSAGMDPEARRFMWGVVAKVSQEQKQSGVVISTHSMEEAEALSTKMGIQVQGGIFRCFGSSQHIKNKFSTGYEIELKFKTMSDDEISHLKKTLGINQNMETMQLADFISFLKNQQVEKFIIDEISEDNYGSDLYNMQKQFKCIDIHQALQWLHTECYGLKLIKFLTEQFGEVEILEHVSDFYKVRVPKGDKTIGYTFGSIEDVKQRMRVSEYSVSQTTLEQIFQTFAKVTIAGPADRILVKQIQDSKLQAKIIKTRAGEDDQETILTHTNWMNTFDQLLEGEGMKDTQVQII